MKPYRQASCDEPLRIAVLISGRGSNLKALIDACAGPDFPAKIVLVLSSNPDAPGLDYAKAALLPHEIVDHRLFPDRADFDARLDEKLRNAQIELICLAGFMRLFTSGFACEWGPRMLNIHPSLLPDFKGLNTHQRVIDAGVKQTGCTVHFVQSEMDTGFIVLQKRVEIMPDDTPESLADRVLAAEHLLYPAALKAVTLGEIAAPTLD